MHVREIDDENQPEPIPGLPAALPEGEEILWQGAPRFLALAVHAFRVRAVAVYFAVIALWRTAAMASAGAATSDIVSTLSAIAIFFIAGMALLFGLAWLMKKETIYTITSRRIVMRYGVALRKTVNIPFAIIGAASLKPHSRGAGDIAVQLTGSDRIAYLQLWPHVRPFRYGKAEPTLRAIPDAARVAALLAGAVKAAGANITLNHINASDRTPETTALAGVTAAA
ncbi:MAG: photosynthetic complex putative assembly protein PuhB [Parvularculaceae bacterium]|nr:photosynthetic complex putative assembly protein PuhB [Parvularculaceae bacterium]